MAVHLRQIRLVHSASADILRVDASRGAQLMLQTKTPIHEIGCIKFSVGYRSDGHRRKTSCWIRSCRRAGNLALFKSRTKCLIGGHSCVYGTVRQSRRNGCAACSSKKSALKSLDVGWVDTDYIRDGAGQNVAENPEAGTQHRLGVKLPRNRCSRLQDRQGRRGKYLAEIGLDRGV